MNLAGGKLLFSGVPRTWSGGLSALGLLALSVCYVDLLFLSDRVGFVKGVEYWLFRPSDSVPAVIVGLSLWLVYRRHQRFAALEKRTGSRSLIAFALFSGTAIYAWAVYTSARDLQILAGVLQCLGLVVLHRGLAGLRVVWLPIAFLLFAIPMPAPLLLVVVFKLQLWAAQCAGWLLYVIGVPALVSGDQILRASQTFQVVEGCSGLRSIETLTMLTVLLIDLFRRRGLHAGLLFVSAPLIAFAFNGVRVVTLVLNPHSEIIAVHNTQGVVILLAGLLSVYLLDGLLERFLPNRDGNGASGAVRDVPPAHRVFRASPAVVLLVAGATAAASLWAPVWEPPRSDRPPLHQVVSEALDPWPWSKLEENLFFRGSVRFGKVVSRRYEVEGAPVSVFVATSDLAQRGGSPISPITALPGSGWVVRETEPGDFAPGGAGVEVLLAQKGKQRLLVYHSNRGDRGLAIETVRSLLALDRSLWARSTPIVVVRLSTEIVGRSPAARARAESRLTSVHERLGPALAVSILGATPRPDSQLRALVRPWNEMAAGHGVGTLVPTFPK